MNLAKKGCIELYSLTIFEVSCEGNNRVVYALVIYANK